MKRLALLVLLAAASGVPAAHAQTPRVHVVQPGETLYRIATTNGVTVTELKALNGLAGDTIQVGQRLRLPGDARPSDPTPSDPTPEATPEATPEQTGPPPTDRPDITPTPPAEPDPVAPVRLGDGARPSRPAGGTASGAETQIHTVSRGETLFRIALRYDTTVDALRRLNGIRGDQIEVGQRLVVSGSRPAGAPATLVRREQWDIDRTTVPADLVHFVEPGETLYSIAMAYGFTLDALIAQNAVTTAPLVPGTMLVLPERVDPGAALREGLPDADDSGLALVFPDVMSGRATAYGEAYDPLALTASHRDLPYGTVVLVTNPATGRSTFVRIADRGPVSQAYLMELSSAAAAALGLDPDAAARVELRRLP